MKQSWLVLSFLFVFFVSFFLFLNFTVLEADIVLHNGVVYTVDDRWTVTEAIAIKGDKIVKAGKNEDILKKFKTKRLIDLEGKAVFPGFIDSHAHLLSLGAGVSALNLVGTTSMEQIAAMVAERVRQSQSGQWIRGRGWDQNNWPVKQFPKHEVLDKVSPNNPVYLRRIDGHAVWVNKQVLELSHITKDTKDPEGGRILRRANGKPTGVLIDAAQGLIESALPPPTEHEVEDAAKAAIKICLEYGLTSVQDMGVRLESIKLYKKLVDRGEFLLRDFVAVAGQGEAWDYYLKQGPEIGYGNNHLTVRSIKLVADGALGSRGAAMIEPYSDDPGNRGLTLLSENDIYQVALQALGKGFQVCTHAIGDRGNNIVLNAYEKALKAKPVADHRFRIEHAQVLNPNDIPRFKQLGIIPSMQPTHCTSDMYWAEARLGLKRVRGAYAWRSLLNTGVMIAGGSDFPVESPNPLWGIYAAVTRQDHQGRPTNWRDVKQYFQPSSEGIQDMSAFENGWYANQKMAMQEAVKAFTIWAAKSAFEEDLKGSIEKGKLADLVVLSKDITKIEPREILNTEVLLTMVDGKIVYAKEKELVRK